MSRPGEQLPTLRPLPPPRPSARAPVGFRPAQAARSLSWRPGPSGRSLPVCICERPRTHACANVGFFPDAGGTRGCWSTPALAPGSPPASPRDLTRSPPAPLWPSGRRRPARAWTRLPRRRPGGHRCPAGGLASRSAGTLVPAGVPRLVKSSFYSVCLSLSLAPFTPSRDRNRAGDGRPDPVLRTAGLTVSLYPCHKAFNSILKRMQLLRLSFLEGHFLIPSAECVTGDGSVKIFFLGVCFVSLLGLFGGWVTR